jgi:hypothetical protein
MLWVEDASLLYLLGGNNVVNYNKLFFSQLSSRGNDARSRFRRPMETAAVCPPTEECPSRAVMRTGLASSPIHLY